MAKSENLLSIQQYADLKNVHRSTIEGRIAANIITPTVLGKYKYIDTSKYGNLDFSDALPGRPAVAVEMKKEMAVIKQRLKRLENTVYQNTGKKKSNVP